MAAARQRPASTNLYNMTAADAVDFVASFFGIHPLSTTTRNALIAAHQAERLDAVEQLVGRHQPADHDHARTRISHGMRR